MTQNPSPHAPPSPSDEPLLDRVVEPICRAHGLELVEVRQLRQPGGWLVRVTIDREPPDIGGGLEGSGVTLDDCTGVSRDLSTALDIHEDLIPGSYRLEVSSPGVERPLVAERDYARFEGREAVIQTSTPIEGRRRFTGTLRGVASGAVLLERDGVRMSIPLDVIRKARLVYRS